MPLYIDGTKMPNPSFNAISCSDEKVWSSNTGRSKSAYMNGSIVQVKKTRQLSFPPLTRAELDKLNGVINNASSPGILLSWRIPPGIRCFLSAATLARPVGRLIPVPGIAGISSTTK